MTAVAASAATSAVATTPTPIGNTGTIAPSLLATPSSDAMPGDALSAMYLLMQARRQTSLEVGRSEVESRKQDKELAMATEKQALADEADAKESAEKWGILGKVASVIAIAVSAVASAFSCGAASGLLVASCALSAMAFVEGETHALGKLTGNEDNSKWFTLGLGISSAVCGGAAGIVSSSATLGVKVLEVGGEAAKISSDVVGSTVTSSEGSTAAMVLGISGAVAGGAGAITSAVQTASGIVKKGGEALSKGARLAATTGHVVGATATATAAVGNSAATFASADAVDAQADAKIAKQQMAKLDRLIQWVIDGVKETDGSHKRAMETLQGAMQTQGQTLVTASSMRV